jgi:hypothetical protein
MERGIAKNRPPSPAEAAMLDLIEKNSTDKFKDYFKVSDEWWLRNQGADHIVVMPAPVTNLRHERYAYEDTDSVLQSLIYIAGEGRPADSFTTCFTSKTQFLLLSSIRRGMLVLSGFR